MPSPPFIYPINVRFSDTDAAGYVHFSAIALYVEEAEHALLRQLSIPLLEKARWPRVSFQAQYLSPIKPFQSLFLSLHLHQIGCTSLHWRFALHDDNTHYASGSMSCVHIDLHGSPAPLLSVWKQALEPFLSLKKT